MGQGRNARHGVSGLAGKASWNCAVDTDNVHQGPRLLGFMGVVPRHSLHAHVHELQVSDIGRTGTNYVNGTFDHVHEHMHLRVVRPSTRLAVMCWFHALLPFIGAGGKIHWSSRSYHANRVSTQET